MLGHMSITARHKKPGGFKKLVNSLETTAPDRQNKILEAMRAEDPDFVDEVERCLFKFEEFSLVQDLVMAEIIEGMKAEPRTLALALFKCPDTVLVEKFKKNMRPPIAFEVKEVTEGLTQVLQREQISSRYRIIAKARELESQRKITLKKYSQKYPDEQ
jgi:flagellar motor switch protein FliG